MAQAVVPGFSGVHWIKQRPTSDATDPLGMNLRVGARLGAQLLYCITSVTLRARYYSFLPWCMMRYRKTQRGAPHDPGLVQAVFSREKALAIGCVAHHEGEACARGGVVGSRRIVRSFADFQGRAFNPSTVELVQDPALMVYIASLVNLGLVRETNSTEKAEAENGVQDERVTVASWNDVELTELGLEIATAYEEATSGAPASRQLDNPAESVTWQGAADWASVGGFCELATEHAPDREVLLDMFFCRRLSSGETHKLRRETLLLILALAGQLQESGGGLSSNTFMAAVYTGRVENAHGPITVSVPLPLADIAARWKAYSSHVLLTTALQSLLSHVTSALRANDAHCVSLAELAQSLSDPALSASFAKHANVALEGHFGNLTPAEVGTRLARGRVAGEQAPSMLAHSFAELLRDMDVRGSPAGLALGLSLTALVLADYRSWREADAGRWLGRASQDDDDVSPALMFHRLEQRFGEWTEVPWQELTPYLLRKFVVGLHSNLAYEKQGRLLHLDDAQIRGSQAFNDVNAGFPRLGSAFTILQDLALLEEGEDGFLRVMNAGRELLETELNGGASR